MGLLVKSSKGISDDSLRVLVITFPSSSEISSEFRYETKTVGEKETLLGEDGEGLSLLDADVVWATSDPVSGAAVDKDAPEL